MNYLLASSATIEGITSMIAEFCCSAPGSIELQKKDGAFAVFIRGQECSGVRVVKRGKRYRFEMVAIS